MNEKPYDNRQCAICLFNIGRAEDHCFYRFDVQKYEFRDKYRCSLFREAGSGVLLELQKIKQRLNEMTPKELVDLVDKCEKPSDELVASYAPLERAVLSSEYITCNECGKTSLFKPVDEINPATFKCFDCWKKEKNKECVL